MFRTAPQKGTTRYNLKTKVRSFSSLEYFLYPRGRHNSCSQKRIINLFPSCKSLWQSGPLVRVSRKCFYLWPNETVVRKGRVKLDSSLIQRGQPADTQPVYLWIAPFMCKYEFLFNTGSDCGGQRSMLNLGWYGCPQMAAVWHV